MTSSSFGNLPDEVKKWICEYCSSVTLYALARTSRDINKVAVPVLWTILPDPKPLIELVPDLGSQNEDGTLARWHTFAPSVRYLDVVPLAMTANRYKTLLCAACAFDRPLLPNLRGLFMLTEERQSDFENPIPKPRGSSRKKSKKVCPANWTHAMHFCMLVLGPSLVTLHISYTGATFPDFDAVMLRSPQLSNLTLGDRGEKADYRSNYCNGMLDCMDNDSQERQESIGYQSYGFAGASQSGPVGFGAIVTPHVPATAASLATYVSIQKLTLVGEVMRNTNLLDLGHLPHLNVLVIRRWKEGAHPLSKWGKYEKYTGGDLFTRLKKFSLLSTQSYIAEKVFSLHWMLWHVQHVTWGLTDSVLAGDTLNTYTYTMALNPLSRGAHSLRSFEFIVPGCEQAQEVEAELTRAVAELWSSHLVKCIPSGHDAHIHRWEACD